jgi:Xaa-Pro dipeptidase
MIGPFGYDADLSRSFFCGPGRPTAHQRRLYCVARDALEHNLGLIRSGVAFREMSENAFRLPEEFRAQQMAMTWHGVGLYGQWPTIAGYGHYRADAHLDGVVQLGMVLCCESYVGAIGGLEGVKLEQQVLVTETGYQLLTTFPFEDELLGRQL